MSTEKGQIPAVSHATVHQIAQIRVQKMSFAFNRLRIGTFEGPANGTPPALPEVVTCAWHEALADFEMNFALKKLLNPVSIFT